jgi:hypothetical protein
MQEPEGVTFEPLALTSGVALPSPADLIAVRMTIDPGARVPSDPNDPSRGQADRRIRHVHDPGGCPLGSLPQRRSQCGDRHS